MRLSLNEAAADRLVIGGLPKTRLPTLLGLLVLTVAMTAVASWQLWRERELARLRETFVSSVSHELRTPLAQIRLFVETLRLGRVQSEGERQRAIDIIDEEAARLGHLVENALCFSRGERHVPGDEATSLPPAVTGAVEAFLPLARDRRCTVSVGSIEPAAVRLSADALRQVLLNLLDNAAKFGPPGRRLPSRPSDPAPTSGSRSTMKGRECRPRSGLASGNRFIASIATPSDACPALGLASRSCAGWSHRRAAVSRSRRRPAAAPGSSCICRAPLPLSTPRTRPQRRPHTCPHEPDPHRRGQRQPRVRPAQQPGDRRLRRRRRRGWRRRLDRVQAAPPDLIVLDLMLPDTDGYRVLRTLRGEGYDMPVLVLTARGEEYGQGARVPARGRRLRDQAVRRARSDRAGRRAAAAGPGVGRARLHQAPHAAFGAMHIDEATRTVRSAAKRWR